MNSTSLSSDKRAGRAAKGKDDATGPQKEMISMRCRPPRLERTSRGLCAVVADTCAVVGLGEMSEHTEATCPRRCDRRRERYSVRCLVMDARRLKPPVATIVDSQSHHRGSIVRARGSCHRLTLLTASRCRSLLRSLDLNTEYDWSRQTAGLGTQCEGDALEPHDLASKLRNALLPFRQWRLRHAFRLAH
jgi:hypothetical protein